MDNGFPMFRALGDEMRAALNAKRTELKAAERTAWQVGKDHCAAIVEDKRITAERRRKAQEAKRNALTDAKGQVNLKAFERAMLKGGA